MITLKAPAKINWSLYVLDRRGDGYHNILSFMQCIALYDTLVFEPADGIELLSNMTIPQEENLVFRTAALLKKHADTTLGAKITLRKEIPSGAGLGGGSSDAAFALIGLNKIWGLGLGNHELKQLAAYIGSDVPFFLDGPAAIVQGRGDVLQPVDSLQADSMLIVKPDISVSTASAYAMVAESREDSDIIDSLTNNGEKLNNIKLIIRALGEGRPELLRSSLHNDFEMVVFRRHPVIREIKDRMLDAGAAAALMSGSGSAVFGLFEDNKRALEAAKLFPSFWNRVAETLQTGNDGAVFTH
ncbi:MAG TPA: 4-(cytidine 5'-diphospho)-2-C-methyl-D-erythritol kinase [Dissulfurispiraceae bacterium]|nr:4-(cytidine 5'-diphospho)-2-C-methyl-D-erythritol kinase [Dissulfurispiraceae bacterium]